MKALERVCLLAKALAESIDIRLVFAHEPELMMRQMAWSE